MPGQKHVESQRRWRARNPKWAWAVSAAHRIKKRAEERGLPCTITSVDIHKATPDECPVFNTPFVFNGRGQTPQTPSVDRLDPVKGYVPDNIAVISAKANTIKNVYKADDVWRVALWLTEKDL